MKTAEEILKPFVETVFRHTKIVSEENALTAMKEFAEQGLVWTETKIEAPKENQRVLAWNGWRVFDTSWQQYTGMDEERFKESYTHWMPFINVPPRQ